MKIGIIQQSNSARKEDNLLKLAVKIEALAKAGAELVVLQELHNTPYFCQVEDVRNFDLAETIPGPSTGFFGKVAKENNCLICSLSLRSELQGFTTIRPSSLSEMDP